MFRIILLLVFSLLYTLSIYSQEWLNNIKDFDNFYSIQKSFNDYWQGKEYEKGRGIKPYRRWEQFWEPRVYPTGKFPNGIEIYKEYINFLNSNRELSLLSNNYKWEEVGPTNIPINKLSYQSSGLGRINVVRIHPNNDNIIWVGTAAGGVWRSTNKGNTWKKMGFTDIMSLGVGDIAISESNPNIIYVATGDDNGYFQSNIYSIGIMKSIDGGETWELVGLKSGLGDAIVAARLLVHPKNPDIVYAATSKGLFKSTNGGYEWVEKAQGFFREMEFKPDDPNVIYAVTSGFRSYTGNSAFYKSTNAGETWKKILQQGNINRFEIGVTPKNPNVVYLLGALSQSGSYGGLWRSNNAGDSFELMSNSPNILGINANGSGTYGQGFYDLAIAVSPVNEDLVFIGGIHIWKSTNKGTTWELVNHWTGSNNKPYVHADQHYLLYNPKTLELYSANDGGIYVSTNNGVSWKDISNGLGIMQFYRLSVANSPVEIITGGSQDNGTQLLKNNQWYHVNGGDGMDTQINPLNPDIIFCTTQNGNIYRSTNGGNSFNVVFSPSMIQGESAEWVTPFVLNPFKPSTIYVGYKDLYKSTNNGTNWSKISNYSFSSPIDHIAIAPKDTNIIYIAQSSGIYVTYNGGTTWETLTTLSNVVTGISVDYDDPKRIYVSVSGYTPNERVYEFYGKNRNNITYNLPSLPVNCIVNIKNSAGTLVIGTDVGVFIKNASESKWQVFGTELPPVVVTDIDVNYSNGKIYIATFGRGIWRNEIFSCKLDKPKITYNGKLEFCYGDSVKLSFEGNYYKFSWSNGDTNRTTTIYSTGSYYLTVTDEYGCSARSDVIDVNVKPVPNFIINAENNGYLCNKDSIQLSLPLGLKNYLWSNGDTNRRIFVNKPGKYFATAYAANGCYLISNTVEVSEGIIPNKPIITKNGNLLTADSGWSYKWYYNGKLIQNVDTNVIEMIGDGDYYVEVYSETKCSNVSDTYNFITNVKNIAEDKISIDLIPNPNFGKFNLDIRGVVGKSIIKIIDLNGREVFSKSIDMNYKANIDIDFTNYSQGFYILILQNNGNLYFKDFIKQH